MRYAIFGNTLLLSEVQQNVIIYQASVKEVMTTAEAMGPQQVTI